MKAICSNCGKDWYETPGDMRNRMKRNKSGHIFCSTTCFAKAKRMWLQTEKGGWARVLERKKEEK